MKRNAIVFFIKDGDAVSFPIYNNVCSAQIERIRYWRRFSHTAKREANERTKEKVLKDVERCTKRPRQCGRKSAHKSWPASCNQSLGDCIRWTATAWGGGNIFKRRVQARSGRSQLLRTLPGQNSRKMLRQTCIYFMNAPIFCQSQTFVGANILLMPNFCWRQYFVKA